MRSSLVSSPGTFRPILRLALPVLVEQLLGALVMLVDTWLTGHYLQDAPHLAAISLMAYSVWFLNSIFDFVAIGATALVARTIGAGHARQARFVMHQSLVIGALIAATVTVLGLLGARAFVEAMQLRGEAARLAVEYLWVFIPALLAVMVVRVGIACLRGAGDMRSTLAVMTVVNIVNVALSSALVIGIAPLPQVGWRGLAIGTAAGYVVGAGMVLWLLSAGRAGLKFHPRLLKPRRRPIRRLLKVGIPGGIDMLTIIGCHLWFVSLVNSLGDLAAGAHGVAIRLESLAFMPGAAFQVAAATLAGQFLGAGEPRRAGRMVLSVTLLGCSLMAAVGCVFFFGGERLARLFLVESQGEMIGLTARLLAIVSFAMPLLGLQMILTGALRGAGDTRWPLLFTLLGFSLRIPATYYVIGYTSLGVVGAWYAMVADITLRCVLVVYRFLHGGWKRVVI